jgi:alpha-mannosidase
MNNYWETNYKASQDGWHTFTYVIDVDNKSYVSAISKRLGEEAIKPLLLRNINKDSQSEKTWMTTNNSNITVSSITRTEKGLLVRLSNISDKSIKTSPKWNSSYNVKESDDFGYKTWDLTSEINFRPWEIKTFLLKK